MNVPFFRREGVMLIVIVFISLALLLYTIAIWSERVMKDLKGWMVIMFAAGFMFDLIGTEMMYNVHDSISWNFHSICGLIALAIMGLHFFWALVAKMRHGKFEILFRNHSLKAWVAWLIAFISGLIRL